MTTISTERHPFATAAEFEQALAPYMGLPKPRHVRSGLYLCGSFRVRLLHAGVALLEMYEHAEQDDHPRIRFGGMFAEFLRRTFANIVRDFGADRVSPEHREVARLYGIALPTVTNVEVRAKETA